MRLQSTYYNQLLQEISPLYPTQQQIGAIMSLADLEPAKAVLQGTGEVMWDSVLSLAEKEDKLELLVSTISSDFPDRVLLQQLFTVIKDKTAFVQKLDYVPYIKPVTGKEVKIFLVYDPGQEDSEMVKELKKHLRPLEKYSRKITLYDMHTSPQAGQDKLKTQLQNAGDSEVFLLLLTPSFMGNDDNGCDQLAMAGFEMRKRVIPVLLKDCSWKRIEILNPLMPLPRNEQFVSQWDDQNTALKEISDEIANVVDELRKGR